MMSPCGFDLHFSDSDDEHIFMHLLSTCMSVLLLLFFFGKGLFRSFDHFFNFFFKFLSYMSF